MDTYLVVRTLDVNYAPLSANRVLATINGGDPQPLAPTNQSGVYELLLPAGVSKIEVTATRKHYWPISQKLTLTASSPLPVLTWDGAQSINARNIEVHTRGSGANAVINLVFGQLQDARAKVDAVKGNITLDLKINQVRDLEPILLNPKGSGWDRFRQKLVPCKPDGKMFYAERPDTPKLIAIYHPGYHTTPVPYHVFFTPTTAGDNVKDYPFHLDYVDLINRLILESPNGMEVTSALAAQHQLSGKRPVLVVPIRSPSESLGSIEVQSNLLRLLQEVNYWLQRMSGIGYPMYPVGRCAVSGFSESSKALSTMLSSTYREFDENHLREIYCFDPPSWSESKLAELCQRLARWFRKGADGRKLRAYTQVPSFLAHMQRLLPSGTIVRGPSNAFEDETGSSTLLFDPLDRFWSDMSKEVLSGRAIDKSVSC